MKKLWKTEYKNFILPYYNDSGQKKDKHVNYESYIDIFSNYKVEFVEYPNLDWYDSLKYPRTKGWLDQSNIYTEFLGKTDMTFLKAMLDTRCHRRVAQTVELCCDLYNKEPTVYPVKKMKNGLHPGNTLIHSLKILGRGCKVIRVQHPNFSDNAIIIKKINCLSDIQEIYKGQKIYAFFSNKLKKRSFQVLVCHGNFSTFDSNGNLQWKSDREPWPLKTFLQKLVSNTSDINDAEAVTLNYNNNEFEVKMPTNVCLRKEIFLETIKWGNENIKF